MKCQRKDSKKAKEYRQFRGVLGRLRTAAMTVQLFMPISGVEKWPFSKFFFSALGGHVSDLARKSLS